MLGLNNFKGEKRKGFIDMTVGAVRGLCGRSCVQHHCGRVNHCPLARQDRALLLGHQRDRRKARRRLVQVRSARLAESVRLNAGSFQDFQGRLFAEQDRYRREGKYFFNSEDSQDERPTQKGGALNG